MTRTLRKGITLLVFVSIIAAVIVYANRPQPVKVTLATVENGIVESTVANTRAGTVMACRRARMAPPTGGQIAHLWVHEGDAVKRDQLLLELWNDDLAAQLTLVKSELTSAQAQAHQACLMADNAEREAQRKLTLSKKGLASDEDADNALTNAKARRASCEAATAQTDVSRARVTLARAQLERSRLRAPFDGTVAEVNGEIGEFVTPSPTGVQTLPAIDLVDNSCLYISAPIDEVDAPQVRPGMDARISLDAFPHRAFPGIVQRIAPYVLELEKQARTVDVETVFVNPEDFRPLLPGYSADTEIILEVRRQTLRIPTQALLEGGRVLVFSAADGMLSERRVETGLANWNFTEILSGLSAGDQVVTSVDREGVAAGTHAVAERSPAP